MTVLSMAKEILGVEYAHHGDGYQLPHGSIPPRHHIVAPLLIDPAAGPCSGPWSMSLVLEHEPGPGA